MLLVAVAVQKWTTPGRPEIPTLSKNSPIAVRGPEIRSRTIQFSVLPLRHDQFQSEWRQCA